MKWIYFLSCHRFLIVTPFPCRGVFRNLSSFYGQTFCKGDHPFSTCPKISEKTNGKFSENFAYVPNGSTKWSTAKY